MIFRSVHSEFSRAIERLHALRVKAEQKRDQFSEAAAHFAQESMRHDDVVFQIEQMIGPAELAEVPEDDQEGN